MHEYEQKFGHLEPELWMTVLWLPSHSWCGEGRIQCILSRVWRNGHHVPSKRYKMLEMGQSFGTRDEYSISSQPSQNVNKPEVQQAPWSIVNKTPSHNMSITNFLWTGPSCTYLYGMHTKHQQRHSANDVPHTSRHDSSRFLWSTPFLFMRRCRSLICSCGKRLGTIPAYGW